MKTNTIYTALAAILAAVLTLSVYSESMAQSSSRRNTSGGNTTSTQRSSDSKQKEGQVSQPKTGNASPARSANTTGSTTSSDRKATVNRGNSSTNGSNARTVDNNRSGSGNIVNRPENNRSGNNNVNRSDNNRSGNSNVSRPENNRTGNSNVNRPGNSSRSNNIGPRPVYYAGRGGDAATKLPPAPPKFDRNNSKRHVDYIPFLDGRVYHRPSPVRAHYDFGYRYTSRPRNYYRYRIKGMSMYFWDGTWYWHAYGYYNVHRPPVGTRIPISYIASSVYPVDFEYYINSYGGEYYVDSYANFYVRINSSQLKVVDAPDGAILYDLPSDYEELIYNGRVYYLVGNSIFEYVYSTANSWYFRAVGIYR